MSERKPLERLTECEDGHLYFPDGALVMLKRRIGRPMPAILEEPVRNFDSAVEEYREDIPGEVRDLINAYFISFPHPRTFTESGKTYSCYALQFYQTFRK
ncbi:hypothetical protein HYV50_05250 [Candidatus Pacearchaeota archaeon]|nr:hypothetical protein [Candidatus Pacearchaeota archaeon]